MTPSYLASAQAPSETLLITAAALCIIPVIFGFFIQKPKLVVLGFVGILFLFSDSSWGELEAQSTIYGRGSGLFYFSLLNLILLVAGFAALTKRLASANGPALAPPMTKYLTAIVFMLLGHLVIGLMLGKEPYEILSQHGIINVLNMLVFMYMVIMAFDNDRDTAQLVYTILALAAVRAVFGLVRYAAFGGDDANPYRNFEGLDMKLVYFDINDGFVAGLGAFCAAWMLTAREMKLRLPARVLLVGLLALEIATVALSFRRSALIGLGLMFGFLFLRLPGRKKLLFAVAAMAALSVIAIVFFQQRLHYTTTGGVFDSLIYDISPDRGGIKQNRFYELYAAAQSLSGHWLFGLGTWGSFTGDKQLLDYHGEDFGFVHSGFGHMILKAGVVGFILFAGIMVSYVLFYLRHRKRLVGTARLLADTGFAGFLFWVPTLLIGTPIIEFRTMMMLGFTLALPFVAVGLQHYQVRRYMAYQQSYATA